MSYSPLWSETSIFLGMLVCAVVASACNRSQQLSALTITKLRVRPLSANQASVRGSCQKASSSACRRRKVFMSGRLAFQARFLRSSEASYYWSTSAIATVLLSIERSGEPERSASPWPYNRYGLDSRPEVRSNILHRKAFRCWLKPPF